MEIYIVRHGETVWNKEKRIQGRADIELNEYGRELAIKTGEALKDVHFDIIYSSPLKRAFETACLIRGNRNIDIIKDDRIKEVSFGIFEGQCMDELIENGTSFKNFFDHPEVYSPAEEGESLEDLCIRAKDFICEVIEKHKNKSQRIMIVAHGALNKAIMMYVKNHPMENFWSGGLQRNCNVIIFDYDENRENKFNIIDEQKVFYD